MKPSTLITLALFCFLCFTGNAQTGSSDIVIGEKVSIQTEAYGAERTLRIFVPQHYQDSNKTYPVLYLLDGQNWFNYTVSIHNLLTGFDYLPEFIVVGIDTEDAGRFGFFANSDKLLDFLEKDVIDHVDANYRTNKERMLFGWQFAGAFTIETMAKRPELFNAYFAASPIPLNNQRMQAISALCSKGTELQKTLFFATSLNENGVEPGARALEDLLTKEAPESLNWKYEVMTNETIVSFGHRTTPLGTIYQGLRSHYEDYPTLEFNNLEDFRRLGGHDYVQSYYKNRSEKYGVPEEIPEEGMFFLVRLGLDSDDYPTFKRFMDDFRETGFLDNINVGWGSRYAEFYLKYNDYNGAKYVYEKLIERFPNDARPVNGLGHAYQAEGKLDLAKSYYINAINLAKKHNDRRLEAYEKDLKDLKKKQ